MSTVGDLLFHLPFRYEDRREIRGVGELLAAAEDGPVTVIGELRGVRRVFTRRRGLVVVRGLLCDAAAAAPAAAGTLAVVWFNRPYLPAQVEPGRRYLLHGTLRRGKAGPELLNPSCEPHDQEAASAVHAARVVPVYPAAGALGPAYLRRLVAAVLELLDFAAVDDWLPAELRRRHGLPTLGAAWRALHAPAADADLEALDQRSTPAHHRLLYGELLELQLTLALRRERRTARVKPQRYRTGAAAEEVAVGRLPFALTAAQRRVWGEIVADLAAPRPMLRLLQGDVGSGKTALAALAAALAIESGWQVAFMAPTELLAEQHLRSLAALLGGRYRLALLSGSAPGAAAVRAATARGEVQLLVGTHALIQQGVSFAGLGLAVIDEQHRFGVAQRAALEEKGGAPDVLAMTATPIPRSLALTLYGDLDVSVLDELPPGRRPVATELLPAKARARALAAVRAELAAGGQVYVALPLIDEPDPRLGGGAASGPASVAAARERLAAELAPVETAVLHGRMSAPERAAVMERFTAGELRVLIATTVIEVGVDVAGAGLMLIEGGERFGLAQLHQLRGRVGRGSRAARCIVLHGPLTLEAERRLEVFAGTTDGFRLAEADLALRGPGELVGMRQSGLPPLRLFAAAGDERLAWLTRARDDAREVMALIHQGGGGIEHEMLVARVERLAAAAAGGG